VERHRLTGRPWCRYRRHGTPCTVDSVGFRFGDARFLRRLSDLIGSYDRVMTSETHSRGHGRQRSRSVQERTILTIAELRELPRGRAILFASGTPAVMIEPQPWYTNPTLAAVVQASIDAHTPAAIAPEAGRTASRRGSAA